MSEKRREKRVREQTKFTITVISKDRILPSKKIIHHMTKDISLVGAKIQTKIFLPVDTFLKIDLMLTKPSRLISAFAKVRWVKSLYADELFEMGIEFVDTSLDIIKALKEHFEKMG